MNNILIVLFLVLVPAASFGIDSWAFQKIISSGHRYKSSPVKTDQSPIDVFKSDDLGSSRREIPGCSRMEPSALQKLALWIRKEIKSRFGL